MGTVAKLTTDYADDAEHVLNCYLNRKYVGYVLVLCSWDCGCLNHNPNYQCASSY